MSDKEVVFSTDLNTYEPCTTCLDVAMEAAYTNGFITEDDEFDYVIDESFDDYGPLFRPEAYTDLKENSC